MVGVAGLGVGEAAADEAWSPGWKDPVERLWMDGWVLLDRGGGWMAEVLLLVWGMELLLEVVMVVLAVGVLLLLLAGWE